MIAKVIVASVAVAAAHATELGLGYTSQGLNSYGHEYAAHAAPLAYAHAAPLNYAAAAPIVTKADIAYPPQPYRFGYESVDEYGTKQSRHEVSDAHNNKKGSYSFTDVHGISRHVEYVADKLGFRASIKTNEPGTAPSAPAAAHYNAAPLDVKTSAAAPITAYAHAPAYGHY